MKAGKQNFIRDLENIGGSETSVASWVAGISTVLNSISQ